MVESTPVVGGYSPGHINALKHVVIGVDHGSCKSDAVGALASAVLLFVFKSRICAVALSPTKVVVGAFHAGLAPACAVTLTLPAFRVVMVTDVLPLLSVVDVADDRFAVAGVAFHVTS
ncbi:Uncharacterised protein [Salmonella enterica subsp. arizonae]|uniref:Uncharacterized protein n=1 Tax=Salmonella enterica subsp. arizonae TaxID=59203 RepID=A0A379RVD0_SALER|nr:Uncharacterised protein [Salmonella enterica subsp. arizonae]